MANEITIGAQLRASKSGVGKDSGLITKYLTMTGDDVGGYSQSIAAEADWGDAATLEFPADVATVGYMLIRNLSTANYVELSMDNANPPTMKFAIIPAGVSCFSSRSPRRSTSTRIPRPASSRPGSSRSNPPPGSR